MGRGRRLADLQGVRAGIQRARGVKVAYQWLHLIRHSLYKKKAGFGKDCFAEDGEKRCESLVMESVDLAAEDY